MRSAREAVLKEVQEMLDQVGMKPSRFAREAKVATTTLTRFIDKPDGSILSTLTLMKLRETRDRIVAARAISPDLSQLTKNAKKRALIADLLALEDDDLVAVEDAIKRAPKPLARKRDHSA